MVVITEKEKSMKATEISREDRYMLEHWEQTVSYMGDDDIREQVHLELAPCTNEEFLARYKELFEEKYGVEFYYN